MSDSHPRGAGIYPRRLEPAILPGDYVAIRSVEEVRQVEEVIAQPGVNAFPDGVNVNAGASEADNELEVTELPDNFLGQWRMVHAGEDIPTDIQFQWDFTARAASTFATANARGFHDRTTASIESHDGSSEYTADVVNDALTEIYMFEDQDVFVTFNHTNSGGAQQTVQDVRFAGFMYRLSGPTSAPQGVRPVPIPNAPVTPRV